MSAAADEAPPYAPSHPEIATGQGTGTGSPTHGRVVLAEQPAKKDELPILGHGLCQQAVANRVPNLVRAPQHLQRQMVLCHLRRGTLARPPKVKLDELALYPYLLLPVLDQAGCPTVPVPVGRVPLDGQPQPVHTSSAMASAPRGHAPWTG